MSPNSFSNIRSKPPKKKHSRKPTKEDCENIVNKDNNEYSIWRYYNNENNNSIYYLIKNVGDIDDIKKSKYYEYSVEDDWYYEDEFELEIEF